MQASRNRQLGSNSGMDKRKYLHDDSQMPLLASFHGEHNKMLDGSGCFPLNQFHDTTIQAEDSLPASTRESHISAVSGGLGQLRSGVTTSPNLADESHGTLLEFARENLLLKRELHIANAELARLQSIVQAHEMQKKNVQYASEDEQKSQRRYWTDQEHERFLDAIQNFGHKNVKAISAYVGTRSATQVRTHAQKYFLKAARENKAREKAMIIQVEGKDEGERVEEEDDASRGAHSSNKRRPLNDVEASGTRRRGRTQGRGVEGLAAGESWVRSGKDKVDSGDDKHQDDDDDDDDCDEDEEEVSDQEPSQDRSSRSALQQSSGQAGACAAVVPAGEDKRGGEVESPRGRVEPRRA